MDFMVFIQLSIQVFGDNPNFLFSIHMTDCTESSLLMFMDAVDEFYKLFLDKVNHVLSHGYPNNDTTRLSEVMNRRI